VNVLRAERVTAAGRRGSSRPVVVETSAGARLVKLRGAAQGTGPLVAEIIVAELAESLGLAVPPRSLVALPADVETADWDDELAHLLAASVGLNLGFDFLPGARDVTAADVDAIEPATRAAILWLDRLVLNPDRTPRNPNLLRWSDQLWLVDHGAALGFHYDWAGVSETSPREPGLMPEAHLFETVVTTEELRAADEELAPQLTRGVIEAAGAAVPKSFLLPLLAQASSDSTAAASRIARRRAAYAAFLWKRLKAPRPFLERRALPPERLRSRPHWLTRNA
jgi:hypothetical protein